jgi:hypothetical protein
VPDDRGRVSASLEAQILDLVSAHDEREMAALLLGEQARVDEACSILAELLPALAARDPGLSREAFQRADAFVNNCRA